MKRTLALLTTAAAALALAGAAIGKVPEDVAARLGKDLNPMGGEIAGAGDIPAWDGGLAAPPPGVTFNAAQDQHPDPFPGDTPKFRVNAGNAAQYDANLTDGYKALLRTHSSYFMDVYQTRRTCALPQFVYDALKRNATVGDMTRDGNGVTGAIMASPFPIPNNALELAWNHTLRYRLFKGTRQFAAAPVQRDGSFQLFVVQDEAIITYADPTKQRAEDLNNVSILYIANTVAPARAAGTVILVHESINATVDPRKAWLYSPGTRRVRRAPDIAYDNPGTNTDGMSTSDAFDGYNGAPDRYDWTVLGRSEKFVAMNTYRFTNTKIADALQAAHLNQDTVRYEKHRVWSIEARLKPGTRHIYSRRVKHMPEDTMQFSMAELYDGRGELWRVQEILTSNFYHVPQCNIAGEVVYDLQNRRYLALSLRNEQPPVNYFADELQADRYTPQAIRNLGVR